MDHFCNLSSCLILNQLSRMPKERKIIMEINTGIERKNSCTAYTQSRPSKAQYIIKLDAKIREVSDAPIYPTPPRRDNKLTFMPVMAHKYAIKVPSIPATTSA